MILDTNALSAFADEDVEIRPIVTAADELCLSAVVLGEYRFGIAASRHRLRYERWLEGVTAHWRFLPILAETSAHYAEIRQELKRAGTPLPANDLWIAASAREHGLPILTRDGHFDSIKGLTVLAW